MPCPPTPDKVAVPSTLRLEDPWIVPETSRLNAGFLIFTPRLLLGMIDRLLEELIMGTRLLLVAKDRFIPELLAMSSSLRHTFPCAAFVPKHTIPVPVPSGSVVATWRGRPVIVAPVPIFTELIARSVLTVRLPGTVAEPPARRFWLP